jgi:putative iron-only hydrogenase system regulator
VTTFLRIGLRPVARDLNIILKVSSYGTEEIMEKRLGFVGLIIEDREKNAVLVNTLLSEFGDIILARTGVPCPERNCSAITLVIDATTDQLGSLTGRLGRVSGVSVKSMLSKMQSA